MNLEWLLRALGLMRISEHEQALDVTMEEWAKAADADALTIHRLTNEAKNLRQENIGLRNQIDEMRGQMVAQAHKYGDPAP